MLKILTLLFLIVSLQCLAKPSISSMTNVMVNSSGQLIPPDEYHYKNALRFYMKGDKATAIQRFKFAAEFGSKKADKFISLMYLEGDGVPKNLVEGVAWLRLSAKNGDRESVQLLKSYKQSLPEETLQSADTLYQELKEDYGETAVLNNRYKFKRRFNHQTLGKPGKIQFPNQRVKLNALQIDRLDTQIKQYYIEFQENFGEVVPGDIIIEKN